MASVSAVRVGFIGDAESGPPGLLAYHLQQISLQPGLEIAALSLTKDSLASLPASLESVPRKTTGEILSSPDISTVFLASREVPWSDILDTPKQWVLCPGATEFEHIPIRGNHAQPHYVPGVLRIHDLWPVMGDGDWRSLKNWIAQRKFGELRFVHFQESHFAPTTGRFPWYSILQRIVQMLRLWSLPPCSVRAQLSKIEQHQNTWDFRAEFEFALGVGVLEWSNGRLACQPPRWHVEGTMGAWDSNKWLRIAEDSEVFETPLASESSVPALPYRELLDSSNYDQWKLEREICQSAWEQVSMTGDNELVPIRGGQDQSSDKGNQEHGRGNVLH